MNQYYVLKNGDRHGPFTRTALRGELVAGNFAGVDLVESRDGLPAGAAPYMVPLDHLLNSPPPLPLPGGASGPAVAAVPTAFERQLAVKSRSGTAKPASNKALWIGVSVGVVLMVAFGAFLFYAGQSALKIYNRYARLIDATPEQSALPLLADRAGHVTEWTESSYEPDGDAADPPPAVFQKVTYPSSVGNLVAYVSPDPEDGAKHPAMVWAHGGFGGIGESFWHPASRKNDQSARAFREGGIVLMCPSWRSENSNPGRFELFFGEVDDLLAAVEYVKSLRYVDGNRVYIGGHSTGGTLALLAAAAQADCRAIFSFGGAPNMRNVMEDDDGYGNTPYSLDSQRDHDLRSPIRYTKHIKRPTFYFETGYAMAGHRTWSFFDEFPASKDIPLGEVSNPDQHSLSGGHGFLF